jgi:hypothetical protein
MRAMSVVRNWLYGLGMFTAMTASLVIAFGVAISGPPTDEEMASVDEALGIASSEAGRVTQDLLAQACAEWPELCGTQTILAEVPEEPIAPPAAPPRYEPEVIEPALVIEAPESEAEAALLGSASSAATPRPAPEVRQRAAEVRRAPEVRRRTAEVSPRAAPRRAAAPRARAPVSRRAAARAPAPPPPIEVEQRAALARLMEGVESVLAGVPAAYEAELPPDQAEQQVQSEGDEGYDEGAPDDGYWDDEVDWRVYEEEEELYPELWYN